jgi:acyl-CoA synthetase (NDP forming)
MSIHHLFYPRAVAVVGSAAEGKIGRELIRQILDGGFHQVYSVNPKAQGALGVPGYSAVSQIEQPPDLVVVVSPASTVPGVLEDSGKAGVKAAVIITAGFSEVGNVEGEAEIKRVAGEYGIRLVGPNCAGVINTHHRLFAALETRPPVGQVAFVSQSGAMGGAVLSWAEEQGLGFSKFLSYGNRADLDEIELLPYLAQDQETQVVALYIESVADGRAFLYAVREFTKHKPLVVIKSGRSQAGQRAALSHTGSMAGSDAVYDAALRDSGALRVDTVEEMFDLCKGLVSLPPLRPPALADSRNAPKTRVAIVTNSGGPGVMAADRAEELGLAVSEPDAQLKEKLAHFLPSYCSLRNPFDLTVEGTEAGYRETLCAVLEEYDAALALDVSTPYLDSLALARGVCDAAARSGKPVVASFMAGRIVAEGIAHLKAHGIPNYPLGERAVAVLARMAEYAAFRSSQRTWPEIPQAHRQLARQGGVDARMPWFETSDKPGDRIHASIDARMRRFETSDKPGERIHASMLEPEAMQWLCENGIPTLPFRSAKSVSEAVEGCRQVGYPAVMKVVSPDILHKSECGGVKLNIRDDASAAEAFAAINRSAVGKQFCGAIILPMVQDACEVLLGLSHDSQFGPVVVFGLGGISTEVLRDISLRVAPVDRTQAETMIREIHSFPMLSGFRGQQPRDLKALADTLVTFSRLPFLYPEIAEIDLNPVFLLPRGLAVGDVRVISKEQTKR